MTADFFRGGDRILPAVMRLKVISSVTEQSPWYAEGLTFTCTQCGNCCTGPPGYVWISSVELQRLAEFLKMQQCDVIERYCRKIDGKLSLKEKRGAGGYDCIFLEERKVETVQGGEKVVHTKRVCTVYPVRPLQCRTWPFWPEILNSPKAWEHANGRCPGINQGQRAFSRDQIEVIRDAKDWPDQPPTSAET